MHEFCTLSKLPSIFMHFLALGFTKWSFMEANWSHMGMQVTLRVHKESAGGLKLPVYDGCNETYLGLTR